MKSIRVVSGRPASRWEDAEPSRAIEWALDHSRIVVLTGGQFTVKHSVTIPRSGVPLVIAPDATLTLNRRGSNLEVQVLADHHALPERCGCCRPVGNLDTVDPAIRRSARTGRRTPTSPTVSLILYSLGFNTSQKYRARRYVFTPNRCDALKAGDMDAARELYTELKEIAPYSMATIAAREAITKFVTQ